MLNLLTFICAISVIAIVLSIITLVFIARWFLKCLNRAEGKMQIYLTGRDRWINRAV